MKTFNIILGSLFLSALLYAQNPVVAQYPGALATDANLLVASNNAQSVLISAINSSVTTFTIAVGTHFIAPTALTVDQEIVICQTLTGSTYSSCARGAQGTTAVNHPTGAPVYENMQAIFPNSTNAEVKAIEAALGTNFAGGGTTSQTSSRGLVAADNGTLIAFNGSSLTATLANPPPTSMWTVRILNLNASSLTVSPNSLTINGGGSSITLAQYQSVSIWTDGFNYFQISTPPGSGNIAIGATVSSGTACGVLSVGTGPVLQQDPSNLCYYVGSHDLIIGGNTDAGFSLDIQKSGSSATARIFDQTATTGNTELVIQAGQGQNTAVLSIQSFGGVQKALINGANFVATFPGFVDVGSPSSFNLAGSTQGTVLALANNMGIQWSSTTAYSGSKDVGLIRSGVGTVEINNATPGQQYGTVLQVGSGLFYDNTPSTGTTTVTVQAGAGQSSNDLLKILNNAGQEISGVDAVGEMFVRATGNGNKISGLATNGVVLASGGLVVWCSGVNIDACGSYDSGISRISPGLIGIGNGNQGDFSGTLKSYGLIVGPGGCSGCTAAGAYTLCVSGCSTTIPAGSFSVSAATHGQGVNAIVTCVDPFGTLYSGSGCGATETGLYDGNFTFAPTIGLAKIWIR